jgi:oligoribonuclease NrnB/cAMP/cGMP phosphodiesterase (DHH superfamily)
MNPCRSNGRRGFQSLINFGGNTMSDENENQSVIAVKLDRLILDVEKLNATLDRLAASQATAEIWRERIEQRLNQGAEKMAGLEKEIDDLEKNKIDTKLVAVAIAASGGGGAALMKLASILLGGH